MLLWALSMLVTQNEFLFVNINFDDLENWMLKSLRNFSKVKHL